MRNTLFLSILVLFAACKSQNTAEATIDSSNYDGTEEGTIQVANQEKEKSYHDEFAGTSLVGKFIYFADAMTFTPCGTRDNYSVASDDPEMMIHLEQVYGNARENPGDAIFIEVLGEYQMRPGMEGPNVKTLVVNKLIELNPYRECP